MSPTRHHLSIERQSITHHFTIDELDGYFTVGLFDDGRPGELFVRISKEGSTLSGAMDSFAVAVSLLLQYGVPLEKLVEKFTHVHFEPAGMTRNKEIPTAKSVVDYIFRWMERRFLLDK